ncbi:transcriptional regulator with XRE-family HTH domain [Labrenzia sp. EL_208]|nr:transcriptional regulator with XRE-family HTH domain [Labrenzia sp. EL_132]MBG6228142.1 transcriptional regulator with XRE-family HTH domain [Labrenzia sp. EL_208]
MSDYPHKNARHPVYIWEWRKKSGMTSLAVAEASGIDRSLLSQLETGSKRVNVDHLIKLSKVFKCHPGDILRSPDDPFFQISAEIAELPEAQQKKAKKLILTFFKDDS